ncbi:protein Loquacious [Neodiprion pinetum]|uniref:protein Loquacious n=1 Tax=Neodiprion pinetum TaxID=441929 RepID=UPI001EDE1782|nr:RISC-loading complex subunit tarbp2-like [Neodiprion pinetum]XP_046467879.1 RISC-loading complex subunit tarbp2-like [Neodiprion pinetum]XP_046467880.1 RISC-loading complex subunit tarbp2-like [Neodiprion pinetum]
MSKTPVSILQEMMVKKCTIPNYELIHNGGGSHENTFTYQVTCDGLSATGMGRCKKDAKHEAAKAMLETIAKVNGYPQLPASPAQSPKHNSSTAEAPTAAQTSSNMAFINAIGTLQELCADNNLQEPRYENVSDVGPPHARVFTIHCIVSTFVERGIATTKRQAKHEAAKKMMDRITDVVAGKIRDISIYMKNEKTAYDDELDNVAISQYPELTKLPAIKKPNLGVKISEYHIKVKNTLENNVRYEAIGKLVNLINDAKLKSDSESSYETIRSKFREILIPLNIEMNEIRLNTTNNAGYVAALSLDTSPALIEMNYGDEEEKAKIGAIIKVATTLHMLLV